MRELDFATQQASGLTTRIRCFGFLRNTYSHATNPEVLMNHSLPFRQIGDFQITALSDGNMSASLDLLSGIEKLRRTLFRAMPESMSPAISI